MTISICSDIKKNIRYRLVYISRKFQKLPLRVTSAFMIYLCISKAKDTKAKGRMLKFLFKK